MLRSLTLVFRSMILAWRRRSARRALIWTVAGVFGALLWGPLTPVCSADEIYLIDQNKLFRLQTDEPSQIEIGTVDLEVVDLAFTPDGELWALANTSAIYRVDPETAATTLVRPAFLPGQGSQNAGLARDLAGGRGLEAKKSVLYSGRLLVLPDSTIYVGRSEELTRFDAVTGARSTLLLHPVAEPGQSYSLDTLGLIDGKLMSLGRIFGPDRASYLFGVGENGGAAVPLQAWDWPDDRFFLDFDADSAGHVWVRWNETSVIGVPGSFPSTLSAFDPATGLSVDRASYQFTSPSPIPFAVRRDGIEGSCRASDTSYCFLEGRFQVSAAWSAGLGATGDGHRVVGSTDKAGLMWFFSPDNWELTIKVLDGCELNGHFWVFLSGTTNVEHTVTVTDTTTGETQIYFNPAGESAPAVIDVEAFDGCP